VRRRPGGNGKNMFIVAIKPKSLPWRIRCNGYTTAVSHPIETEREDRRKRETEKRFIESKRERERVRFSAFAV